MHAFLLTVSRLCRWLANRLIDGADVMDGLANACWRAAERQRAR